MLAMGGLDAFLVAVQHIRHSEPIDRVVDGLLEAGVVLGVSEGALEMSAQRVERGQSAGGRSFEVEVVGLSVTTVQIEQGRVGLAEGVVRLPL